MQREHDILPTHGLLLAGASSEDCLDSTAVAVEIVLGLPIEQLHVENQRRVRRDQWGRPEVIIGEARCDPEAGFLPLPHRGDAQLEPQHDLPGLLANEELEGARIFPFPRGAYLRAVEQLGDEVDRDLIAILGPQVVARGWGRLEELLLHAPGQLWRARLLILVIRASILEAAFFAPSLIFLVLCRPPHQARAWGQDGRAKREKENAAYLQL
mmetsp:Transcript_16147/g.41791  ORF Transcript_16147/g.41791 Transcript_16147/m.41791 type:complete len:212 (-) Transcript_16147:22-657(-)